jgi:hypothetical protein
MLGDRLFQYFVDEIINCYSLQFIHKLIIKEPTYFYVFYCQNASLVDIKRDLSTLFACLSKFYSSFTNAKSMNINLKTIPNLIINKT